MSLIYEGAGLPAILEKRYGLRRKPMGATKQGLIRSFRKTEEQVIRDVADVKTMIQGTGCECNWELEPMPIRAEVAGLGFYELRNHLEEQTTELVESFNDRFGEQLELAGNTRFVGEGEWIGEDCFRFRDFEKRVIGRGLTTTTTAIHRVEKDLVGAKVHKPPASHIPQPAKCRTLLKVTPRWMNPVIVTGDEFVKEDVFVGTVTDPNALARSTAWLGKQLSKGVNSAGRAFSAVTSPVARLSTALLADPALIICDRWILYSWND